MTNKLTIKSEAPTSSGFSMLVNTLHVVDASGMTSDRWANMPADASVGDETGYAISVAHATLTVPIRSASGDLIDNVDYSATDYTRLKVVGESIIFRCMKKDGAVLHWVPLADARTAHRFFSYRSAAAIDDTTVAFTGWADMKCDAENYDVGGVYDSVTDYRLEPERLGYWKLNMNWGPANSIVEDTTHSYGARLGGKSGVDQCRGSGVLRSSNLTVTKEIAFNGTEKPEWNSSEFQRNPNTNEAYTWFSGREILRHG